MKFSLQQTRRSTSFRPTPPESSPETTATSAAKPSSPASLFWLLLHGLCCLISLILGFRFSRLVFIFLFSTTSLHDLTTLQLPQQTINASLASANLPSRVVVGRHGIRVRPYPHPNAVEVARAQRIIEVVQREQRVQFGGKNARRAVIVITPTYVRTFQGLHLRGVMHTLMLVDYDVVWVVVEAGGVSNETAGIVGKSGLRVVHVGAGERMPATWEGRMRVEGKMRVHGLRLVR